MALTQEQRVELESDKQLILDTIERVKKFQKKVDEVYRLALDFEVFLGKGVATRCAKVSDSFRSMSIPGLFYDKPLAIQARTMDIKNQFSELRSQASFVQMYPDEISGRLTTLVDTISQKLLEE